MGYGYGRRCRVRSGGWMGGDDRGAGERPRKHGLILCASSVAPTSRRQDRGRWRGVCGGRPRQTPSRFAGASGSVRVFFCPCYVCRRVRRVLFLTRTRVLVFVRADVCVFFFFFNHNFFRLRLCFHGIKKYIYIFFSNLSFFEKSTFRCFVTSVIVFG